MTSNRRYGYNDYDESDFYEDTNEEFSDRDEDYETPDEYEESENVEGFEEDSFNGDDEEIGSPNNMHSYYDKNNPVDFHQIMADYHSDKTYKSDAACEKAMSALEGLVKHIIRTKYSRYSKRFYEDLLQQGRLGVCKGLMAYDPDKSKPATFFYYYILHEMQDFINLMVNNTTSHYDSSVRRIKKIIDQYTREGRTYTPVDLAIDANLPLQTVEHSLQLINAGEMSIDELENTLPVDEKSPEQLYIEAENLHALDAAIHRYLDAEETRVIEMIYGIHGYSPMPTKMISKALNMPTDRIRRYEVTARSKLRHCKELRSLHADHFRDNIIEVNEETVIPLLSDVDLDAALAIMREVEINF